MDKDVKKKKSREFNLSLLRRARLIPTTAHGLLYLEV